MSIAKIRLKGLINLGLVVLLVVLAYAYGLTANTRVHSQGRVKAIGIGVYQDLRCTSLLTLIDWGMVEPSATVNATAYLRNEGNSPILASMSTGNFAPSNASLFLQTTWNYNGSSIGPSEVFQVEIQLHVASNVTGIDAFSFDITIEGRG